MSEYIDFNLNHNVKVKLTEFGINKLKEQHEDLYKEIPGLQPDFKINKDDEGFTYFQLHSLIMQLGHHLSYCGNLPFETNMKVEVEK
jgi:hypothetical protein